MATLANMQAAVSEDLLDPNNIAVSLARVTTAINDAIAYWKFRRFWFNSARNTATLTIGSEVIPLPADFLVPVTDDGGFEIEYSNMRYPLHKLDQTIFDGLWLGNGMGRPQWYCNKSGVYSCYFLPDQAYTIWRIYLKDYVPLVAGTDSNDFSINAYRLIQYWATANLYRSPRQDPQMSEAFFNSAQDEYSNLKIMTDKSNATGGLVIYSSL